MVAVGKIDKRIDKQTTIQRTSSAVSKHTTYSGVVDALMGSETENDHAGGHQMSCPRRGGYILS